MDEKQSQLKRQQLETPVEGAALHKFAGCGLLGHEPLGDH
jgi:hypothetical protein